MRYFSGTVISDVESVMYTWSYLMVATAKELKKRQILQAALEVFAAKGFAGAKISDIAAEAGIGKGVVYDYFVSKEELFNSLFSFFFEEGMKQPEADIPGDPLGELYVRAGNVLTKYAGFGRNMPLIAQFWARSQLAENGHGFGDIWKLFYNNCREMAKKLLLKCSEEGFIRKNVDIEDFSWTFIAVIDGSILQWIHSGGNDALVVRGLKSIEQILQPVLTAKGRNYFLQQIRPAGRSE